MLQTVPHDGIHRQASTFLVGQEAFCGIIDIQAPGWGVGHRACPDNTTRSYKRECLFAAKALGPPQSLPLFSLSGAQLGVLNHSGLALLCVQQPPWRHMEKEHRKHMVQLSLLFVTVTCQEAANMQRDPPAVLKTRQIFLAYQMHSGQWYILSWCMCVCAHTCAGHWTSTHSWMLRPPKFPLQLLLSIFITKNF